MPVRAAVLLAALWILAPGAPAGPASAAVFAVKHFEELVGEAELIFVGTVTGESAQKLPAGLIVTDVSFSASHVLKGGAGGSTVVLRVVGGTVGRETLEIPDVPRFRPGGRYVVFVKGNGRSVFPVVGGTRGLFQVVWDPARSADVVRDALGRPLSDPVVPLAAFLGAVEEELRLR
jgi:hypothetical protein